ncbi:MAG: hypothetical protein HOI23_11215 [Deltaproteobacteria bacterium]|nr:hypothetical protein [Deltaproteobacteria bacterium]
MTETQKTRKWLHIGLYIALLASAAGSIFYTQGLWAAFGAGDLSLWVPLVAPAAFTVFVLIYTVDRWLLVKRRGYPLVRAFVQVAVTLAFLTSLMQRQAVEYKEATEIQASPEAVSDLLAHREARVRAAGCELLALRGELPKYQAIEALALRDKSPVVQDRCTKALDALRAMTQKTQIPTTAPVAPSP